MTPNDPSTSTPPRCGVIVAPGVVLVSPTTTSAHRATSTSAPSSNEHERRTSTRAPYVATSAPRRPRPTTDDHEHERPIERPIERHEHERPSSAAADQSSRPRANRRSEGNVGRSRGHLTPSSTSTSAPSSTSTSASSSTSTSMSACVINKSHDNPTTER